MDFEAQNCEKARRVCPILSVFIFYKQGIRQERKNTTSIT